MEVILAIVFFLLGTIIGSFLNVVILRYNTGRSFGGRSACMVCERSLSGKELIPILSFIYLRGRCLACETKLSLQYPLVELITGLIFAGLFLKLQNVFFTGNSLHFAGIYAYYALLFSLLVVIAVYDLKHKIIPDLLVFVFGVFAFLGIFIMAPAGLWEILSGPIAGAPFALLWLLSGGRWMGLGDAKLAVGLGWLLGLSGVANAFLLAVWTGAFLGILLLIFSKKYGARSEIPFAPFLVLGTIISFFCNLNLISVFRL